MIETAGQTRTCRYPGCSAPAEPAAGPGRPPQYCDDPDHNRASAFRARRAQDAADDSVIDDAGEPVTWARTRAALLVDRLEEAVRSLPSVVEQALAELRTLGDVDAVEVQIETISAAAEQSKASARAELAQAQDEVRRLSAAAREADEQRAEADAAAEEAMRDLAAARAETNTLRDELNAAEQSEQAVRDQLERTETAAATRQAEQTARAEQLAAELAAALADAAAARGQVEELRVGLDAAGGRISTLEQDVARRDGELAEAHAQIQSLASDVVHAREQAATHGQAAAAARESADRMTGDLQDARAALQVAQEALSAVRADLAATAAQLTAARAQVEAERTHGEQRVNDTRDLYGAQVENLRVELAEARAGRDKGA